MKRPWIRHFVLFGFAAAWTASTGSSVFAAKPAVAKFEFRTTGVVVTCGDFDIIDDSFVTVRRTTFFDEAGNPVRLQFHIMTSGTLTNSVTGAFLTDAPDPQNVIRDFLDGTLTFHGLFFRITVPGEGKVFIDAGTVIVGPDGSVTIRNPQREGLEVLCSALH